MNRAKKGYRDENNEFLYRAAGCLFILLISIIKLLYFVCLSVKN